MEERLETKIGDLKKGIKNPFELVDDPYGQANGEIALDRKNFVFEKMFEPFSAPNRLLDYHDSDISFDFVWKLLKYRAHSWSFNVSKDGDLWNFYAEGPTMELFVNMRQGHPYNVDALSNITLCKTDPEDVFERRICYRLNSLTFCKLKDHLHYVYEYNKKRDYFELPPRKNSFWENIFFWFFSTEPLVFFLKDSFVFDDNDLEDYLVDRIKVKTVQAYL